MEKEFSLVNKLEAGQLGFESWQKEKEIFPPKSPDGPWNLVSLIFNADGACSQRIKWLGRQVHRLLPPSAEVKKGCCSSSPLCPSCREEGPYFGLTRITVQ
jgi:hypothetical protein